MPAQRRSGILLHPTSLPGGHGVGDLGREAHRFSEFLAEAGQRLWQVLPLGPTGYGDSPYQCFSAFAGNPLLVSLDTLAEQGWLDPACLKGVRFLEGRASYEAAQAFKLPLLKRAADHFSQHAGPEAHAGFDAFCRREAGWLDDFALFMAAKRLYDGAPWWLWDAALRDRQPEALARLNASEQAELHAVRFTQWAFHQQWAAVHEACRKQGIELVGDLPIYAAADSADVWCARRLWRLNEDGTPAWVAGVPPDYFSATGQLWGNPVYDWAAMAQDGFAWWVERFRAVFALVDSVRVDHFRGFEAYWQVPAGAPTAASGEWRQGPGAALFAAVEAQLGHLAIVAENLGVITPEVEALRERFGYPGMAVLQFAFGTDAQAVSFRPHNYQRELVAYSGTHDNDTTMGWWHAAPGTDSTQTATEVAAERSRALAYLGLENGDDMAWRFIRALLGSVAERVVFPAQDLLGLGEEARMNRPSSSGGNWQWRLWPGALTPYMAARLREMTELYGR